MSRKNKKHIIILNNNGILSATTPKKMVRANFEIRLFEKPQTLAYSGKRQTKKRKFVN